MKKMILPGILCLCCMTQVLMAQKVKSAAVPDAVKSALMKKYPAATAITWEKEKGNFEANWGGKSGEDNSIVYTPAGEFVEQVAAIPVSSLPLGVVTYVKKHFAGEKIKEAGKVTDAQGKMTYEVEVKGKDLIFDGEGNYLKTEKD